MYGDDGCTAVRGFTGCSQGSGLGHPRVLSHEQKQREIYLRGAPDNVALGTVNRSTASWLHSFQLAHHNSQFIAATSAGSFLLAALSLVVICRFVACPCYLPEVCYLFSQCPTKLTPLHTTSVIIHIRHNVTVAPSPAREGEKMNFLCTAIASVCGRSLALDDWLQPQYFHRPPSGYSEI